MKEIEEPPITIIIPTYKRPVLLAKAIQSVLDQTYPHFRLWVCDNASQDETAQVVAKYQAVDRRVHYVCHPTNLGLIANYQYGLSLVKTDFFSFLSDDDCLLDSFFETSLALYAQYPTAAFVAASTTIVTKSGEFVRAPLEEWDREGLFMPPNGALEMIDKYPVPTTILFRKCVIEHAVIDDKNPSYWDCDFLLQIATAHPFAISKKRCGLFLNHEDSYSNHHDIHRITYGHEKLIDNIEKFKHLNQNMVEQLKQRVIKSLNGIFNSFFVYFLVSKNYKVVFDTIALRAKYKKCNFVYSFVAKLCLRVPLMIYGIRLLRKLKHLACR